VAAGLMRIVETILRDQRTVLSVSSVVNDYYGISDICLSLPTVVGRNGIERVLALHLSDDEVAGLKRSAEVLKATAGKLGA
jgi:L-lactate dehydrogenase